jgi:DNA-binding CsgD family transcriptional regulator
MISTTKVLRFLFFNLFVTYFLSGLCAQDFTPLVRQFSKQDYGASNQNWSVAQDSEGLLYFGNNHGLLQFDGLNWEVYRIPENKLVRSIFIDDNDKIYIGSFEEFGYFEKNKYGKLEYTSLSAKLVNYDMKNDEIWTINMVDNKIIFQTFTSYFIYHNDIVEGIRQPYTFLFFSVYEDNLYTHTYQNGLSTIDFNSNSVIPFNCGDKKCNEVISVLPFVNSKGLIVTKSSGLYILEDKEINRFTTEEDNLLDKVEVNRAVTTPNGDIILGTIQNGIIALSKDGKRLWSLNRSNILQNNTVLGLHIDNVGNIWVALDKGIAYVQINSGIRYVQSISPSVGAIYDLLYIKPHLYIGTNQGLYSSIFNERKSEIENVSSIAKVRGQVWNLTNIDDQYFCGNNHGVFEITKNELKQVSPVQGGFCIKKGVIHGQEVVIQGTYTQLCVYLKKNNRWQFSHVIGGFINPVRYLEIDYTGKIWASHLHQGLYEIELTNDLKQIASINVYQSLDGVNKYNINVFKINNRVVFTDHHKFYTYEDIKKKIIPFEELNRKLGHFASSYRVIQFNSEMYWFILDNDIALFKITPNESKMIDMLSYSMFKNQIVDDYQNVVPISSTQCLLTLENGIAVYSLNQNDTDSIKTALGIKQIFVRNNYTKAMSYLEVEDIKNTIQIPYSENNITFSLFYPDYPRLNSVYFKYKLEGIDATWSEPTASGLKNYNFLPSGKYVFKSCVVLNNGEVLSEAEWKFEIMPPFYLSWLAFVFYSLLAILIIYLIVAYFRRKLQRKHLLMKQEDEERQRKEIDKREQMIVTLEKEKLEVELKQKSKELAESTMTIIKKNEMLSMMREEVLRQKELLGSQYPNKYADKLLKMIDQHLSSEDDWAKFQANFDRIHENFFRNLRHNYPELTSNDLRFCAYLRLNLTSKDIANLMNITLKGVEVARYRIRKKINLPSNKSLTEFMIELK